MHPLLETKQLMGLPCEIKDSILSLLPPTELIPFLFVNKELKKFADEKFENEAPFKYYKRNFGRPQKKAARVLAPPSKLKGAFHMAASYALRVVAVVLPVFASMLTAALGFLARAYVGKLAIPFAVIGGGIGLALGVWESIEAVELSEKLYALGYEEYYQKAIPKKTINFN